MRANTGSAAAGAARSIPTTAHSSATRLPARRLPREPITGDGRSFAEVVLLDPVAERVPRDREEARGGGLITAGLGERRHQQRTLHRFEGEARVREVYGHLARRRDADVAAAHAVGAQPEVVRLERVGVRE